MRGPRVLNHPAADRNPQLDGGTRGAGSNLDPSADILCALPHAAQAVSVAIVDDIESRAIIRNF